MKKHNDGYTLIELIVVVAIIAILATTAALSISALSSTAARQCSGEINALLGECRVKAMSKAGTHYLKLTQNADGKIFGEYFKEGDTEPLTTQTLSSRAVSVTWSVTGGADTNLADTPLYIAFDRASGGVANFSGSADGTVDSTAQCLIQVTGASRTYTVTADALTGACLVRG